MKNWIIKLYIYYGPEFPSPFFFFFISCFCFLFYFQYGQRIDGSPSPTFILTTNLGNRAGSEIEFLKKKKRSLKHLAFPLLVL